MLHLSSIDQSSENEVHYDVDDIPVGTRGILRDHLAAVCALVDETEAGARRVGVPGSGFENAENAHFTKQASA